MQMKLPFRKNIKLSIDEISAFWLINFIDNMIDVKKQQLKRYNETQSLLNGGLAALQLMKLKDEIWRLEIIADDIKNQIPSNKFTYERTKNEF